MTDYLSRLSEPEVAGFYRRLAASIQAKFGGDSLAAILLLHWLDGKGRTKVYPARYVKDLVEVRDHLQNVARPIFLSAKKTPSGIIGGIVPRIKAAAKSAQLNSRHKMHLEGNVETPLSIQAKAYVGMNVDPRELDALYALHGFTVISDVTVITVKSCGLSVFGKSRTTGPPGLLLSQCNGPEVYDVSFERWICKASDEYHWNPEKHINVPNPDFGSKDQGAIAPDESTITVYHSNAIRLEKAGLAKSFHDESEPWEENTDIKVCGKATVTVS
jgi:hypothetical protein